jgi:AAA domain
MVNNTPEPQRPPFQIQDDFIETPFEQRFQGPLQDAWQQRSWHVLAASPGSGKSMGIHDLLVRIGAQKTRRETYMPILAIRAPLEKREQSLEMAFSAALGVSPAMRPNARRTWLERTMADVSVECIIIDNAHMLSLSHFRYLKELFDVLAAPPYSRRIGLCLVVTNSGDTVPLKDGFFDSPGVLQRQFLKCMDIERAFVVVQDHSEEEVRQVLAAFEKLYSGQFPNLNLQHWATNIFTSLTNPVLDLDGTGRVTMALLTRFVESVLRRVYMQGATDVDATALQEMTKLMISGRDKTMPGDDKPTDTISQPNVEH